MKTTHKIKSFFKKIFGKKQTRPNQDSETNAKSSPVTNKSAQLAALSLDTQIWNILKASKELINNFNIRQALKKQYEVEVNERTVRRSIRRLRLTGKAIIASKNGYIISKNTNEINQYLAKRENSLQKQKQVLINIQTMNIAGKNVHC